MDALKHIWLLVILSLLLCGSINTGLAQAAVQQGSGQVVPSDSSAKNGLKDTVRNTQPAKKPVKRDLKTLAQMDPQTLTPEELQRLYPPDLVNTLIYDFFATVNGVRYENARTDDQQNEFNAQYNISVNNTLQVKKFMFRFYFYNEYSIRYIVDSITTKGLDGLQARYMLQRQLGGAFSLQANFSVKTQLWPTYQYRDKAGTDVQEKYLYSDYFSPGYLTYTAGLNYNFMDNATLNLGLASGRTTKVRNRDIFASRKMTRLYGLDTGSLRLTTYGLNLLLSVPPQMLNRHFGWECNANLYVDRRQLGRLKGYTLDLQNTLHYVFFKHFRLSLKTSVQYDEMISDKVFMMNALLVGFYLSNKI